MPFCVTLHLLFVVQPTSLIVLNNSLEIEPFPKVSSAVRPDGRLSFVAPPWDIICILPVADEDTSSPQAHSLRQVQCLLARYLQQAHLLPEGVVYDLLRI